MPFDSNSCSKAGKKSKQGPAKIKSQTLNIKWSFLYKKVLDDLLANQDKLTKT